MFYVFVDDDQMIGIDVKQYKQGNYSQQNQMQISNDDGPEAKSQLTEQRNCRSQLQQ